MSNEHINWAFKQPLISSSAKFVLLVLADKAGANNEAFPSVEYLAAATNTNRRTVGRALKELHAAGLVEDTGKTVGRTGRVRVFRVCPGVSLVNVAKPVAESNDDSYQFEKAEPMATNSPHSADVTATESPDSDATMATDCPDSIATNSPGLTGERGQSVMQWGQIRHLIATQCPTEPLYNPQEPPVGETRTRARHAPENKQGKKIALGLFRIYDEIPDPPNLTGDELTELFEPLFVVHPKRRATFGANARAIWLNALGHLPPLWITRSVQTWITKSKFWPTPAELRDTLAQGSREERAANLAKFDAMLPDALGCAQAMLDVELSRLGLLPDGYWPKPPNLKHPEQGFVFPVLGEVRAALQALERANAKREDIPPGDQVGFARHKLNQAANGYRQGPGCCA